MSESTRCAAAVRPLWQIVLVLFLLIAWLMLTLSCRARQTGQAGRFALPMRVTVHFNAPSEGAPLRLVHVFYSGHPSPPMKGREEDRFLSWSIEGKWVRHLLLAGDGAAIDRVAEVKIGLGEGTLVLTCKELRRRCPLWEGKLPAELPDGWEAREITSCLAQASSVFPLCRRIVNYPGDGAIIFRSFRETTQQPVFFLFLGCFGIALAARFYLSRTSRSAAFVQACLTGTGGCKKASQIDCLAAHPCKRSGTWLLASLFLLGACAVLLECRQPYYFTQCDNYAQFLPGTVYGCQTALQGYFPAWNPYQCLGAPLAELGTYALTYPLTYVSYLLAAQVFAGPFATLDVFCWLHLAGGLAAFFWFVRRIGVAQPLCAAAALSWALSGYALIIGRAWYYMTPGLLWLPLLGVSAMALRDRAPGWGWGLGTALVIGLFFHAGNAQMWVYGLAFFVLLLFLSAACGRMPWSRLLQATPALVGGIAFAAPLLVPQFLATRQLTRTSGDAFGIWSELHCIFLPYPLARPTAFCNFGNVDAEYRGQLFYAGGLFSLAWLGQMVFVWVLAGGVRKCARNPAFLLALVALLLSMGNAGGLWFLQAKLPVLDKFRGPEKLLVFHHFFALASGAIVMHQVLCRAQRRRLWLSGCFVAVAILTVYHVTLARSAFYQYGDTPYPRMPDGQAAVLASPPRGPRILPVAPLRSPLPGYALGMKRNFATVYRVNSLAGYDPLVEERPEYLQLTERLHADFVHTLRKYGVTYIVLHRSAWSPVYSENPVYRPIETQSLLLHEPVRVYCQQRRPIYEGPGVRILAVDDPEPLAFCIDRPDLPLPLEETPAGIKVDASPLPQGGKVVVNYLWYPNIRVSADGRALVCDADRFGRIATEIPAATRTLTVGYRSAWLDGLGIGAGLLCVGLVLQIILSRIFLEPVNGNTDDPIARRHQSATPVHGSPGG